MEKIAKCPVCKTGQGEIIFNENDATWSVVCDDCKWTPFRYSTGEINKKLPIMRWNRWSAGEPNDGRFDI
jgi:hypothetical protein